MNKGNIILVGFMGVGKGTIARELVKQSSLFAIDTDDLIESIENRKVKKIFEQDGEQYFRNLEKRCALWLEENVSNTLISTGGGFYKQENLNKIGKVIYLQSSFEGILNRINNSEDAQKKLKKRPLLKNLEEAKKLYDIRVSDYIKVADIIINVENRNIIDITEEILEKI
ncbi:shikimate kinase [Malaciobacter molluscorum LMG 25693]|uniref:Shikimate kinase n=1 Tax=Malaciobacter molluscorum LMG 25693 TaxID=870501 RepID=A0A2G1DJY8_9BACT|nr:shikimate kinase [Malaciobacter molluscorum]AXX91446.1 shikimate kinase [Malaciobacter molluscorum LMG 25693]PHO18807.1 shikimate kinase [Malaciobacter molluscorum LMG 25693]RXJ94439.1 shikimate kinase [Malaciobacter molluscorum]